MPLQVTNVQQREHVFISALPGLEPAVEAEAQALGFSPRRVEGGVELTGEPGLHREANLRLRTASRVLLRLGRFSAPDAGALEKGLAGLPLGRVWDGRTAPRLSVALHRARFKGPDAVVTAAARAWRLASVERAGALDEESSEGLTLLVRVEGDTCTVSADTSGEPLHRRGYRQEVSRAPLRETLAAGILVLAGYDGVEPLVDPMCGSGTFLIEGAWMSQRRAPGLQRSFAFERFPGFDAADWSARQARAGTETLPAPRSASRGYDINAGSLGTARRNARRAGVTLTLERQDVRTLVPPAGLGPGLVVVNPPYGKRVGEAEDLPGLYRALGATFRRAFAGWRAAVLVPEDTGLIRALGLPEGRNLPVRNGGLRCRLLLCSLPPAQGA
ncbi:RNA methyltransferase [Archangium violaceum]|uniref:THUMP domain-containing class I SAM-dependent RNA methyltransferase n=1 Tax=Archangium violaceum TaxID=83451 RepID=UPI00193C4216|nr:RNA methyltransferase [Archangium violaceum]QRK09195.1 RNA methyltransferase [Archangium violaceum]